MGASPHQDVKLEPTSTPFQMRNFVKTHHKGVGPIMPFRIHFVKHRILSLFESGRCPEKSQKQIIGAKLRKRKLDRKDRGANERLTLPVKKGQTVQKCRSLTDSKNIAKSPF